MGLGWAGLVGYSLMGKVGRRAKESSSKLQMTNGKRQTGENGQMALAINGTDQWHLYSVLRPLSRLRPRRRPVQSSMKRTIQQA